MADKTNTQDIEDVLSSIRKLVTEDDAPRQPRITLATAKPVAPKANDEKLLLTPQLRVTEPEDPYQMVRSLTAAQPETVSVTETSIEAPSDIVVPVEEETIDLGILEDTPELHEAVSDAPSITERSVEEEPFTEDVVEDQLAPVNEETLAMFSHTSNDAESDAECMVDEETSQSMPIDEDTLRDLIAEVVREELTGAMGEKITRNVRKLVRREIRKLTASEELE